MPILTTEKLIYRDTKGFSRDIPQSGFHTPYCTNNYPYDGLAYGPCDHMVVKWLHVPGILTQYHRLEALLYDICHILTRMGLTKTTYTLVSFHTNKVPVFIPAQRCSQTSVIFICYLNSPRLLLESIVVIDFLLVCIYPATK